MPANTKTVDGKGRLLLGDRFANCTVIIQDVDDTEVTVTIARVIPQREVWLFENPAVKAAVFEGIAQARRQEFAHAPDMTAAKALADSIADETEADDGLRSKVDAPSGKPVRRTAKRGTAIPETEACELADA